MLRNLINTIFGKGRSHGAVQTPKLSVAEVIAKLHTGSQLCVRASHADGVTRSKLGGHPLVPEAFEWPEWNGAPLQFLCQLDLNDIQEALQVSWLPKGGLLSFFYDEEQSTWGFDPADKGSWRVFLFDSGPATELAPKGLAASVLPEVFLRFEQHVSLPHPERIG